MTRNMNTVSDVTVPVYIRDQERSSIQIKVLEMHKQNFCMKQFLFIALGGRPLVVLSTLKTVSLLTQQETLMNQREHTQERHKAHGLRQSFLQQSSALGGDTAQTVWALIEGVIS